MATRGRLRQRFTIEYAILGLKDRPWRRAVGGGRNKMSEAGEIQTPQEVELKFESRANSQLKFVPIESSRVIIDKLRTLCSLLHIEMGPDSQQEIVDEYFDDDRLTLSAASCSLRRRVENGTGRSPTPRRRTSSPGAPASPPSPTHRSSSARGALTAPHPPARR